MIRGKNSCKSLLPPVSMRSTPERICSSSGKLFPSKVDSSLKRFTVFKEASGKSLTL